ncbi:hypothetical protein [Ancylomarina sp. 16SWW S1-10-2]|uniref:hypothetical protein n=1 Tax=Ancylomarina sp. 16SWW S1-10-2 TaxID=2499681 RepID=UPI0012AE61DB|nr:hypothetical protein [Ancylomarina sp. 16SWW S1-10-2]MRT93861.1 hypothetical protein [Ancylomarina sp. 16SWW S1-10-2]
MNKITLLNIEYLRRERGIETYQLSLKEEKEICYVYNFEDKYYRYFRTLKSLTNYLKDRIEPKVKFKTREELDDFLLYKNIVPIEEINKAFVGAKA